MKARLLLIVPLPPPMHGSNLMNQHVIQCRELYQQFDVKVLPLNYAKSISDIGSFRIQKFFLLLVYLTRLVTELKKFQPDIAYFVPAITGGSFYRDCLFAALLKCFKVKTVYHLHGKGIADKLSSPVLFHLYRWFFKDAFIIHLSPMLYGDIQSIVDFNQCRFLPNGIDMPIALKNDKKSIGRDNPPKFLFLSNLVPTKGPLILLEACKILLEKGVSFKTYFVGNPSSELTKSYLSQNIKQMGLCNYVEYLGPLYGGEKHDVLLNSDCLVFPTYKEAFGLVILEAMASKLVVISTREGSIPEIIEHGKTGFIVEKQSPTDLASTMEYMVNHPDLFNTMGKAGQQKFKRSYTIERFHKNLLQIFNELVFL